eukprot:1057260-Prymnesium_polylepis.1
MFVAWGVLGSLGRGSVMGVRSMRSRFPHVGAEQVRAALAAWRGAERCAIGVPVVAKKLFVFKSNRTEYTT